MLYEVPPGDKFVTFLKRMTKQGLWVVPLGDDQYQVCEPREWFCDICGRYVDDAPQCAHGEEMSDAGEHKVQYFNYLMFKVDNVTDFERECEADHSGGR